MNSFYFLFFFPKIISDNQKNNMEILLKVILTIGGVLIGGVLGYFIYKLKQDYDIKQEREIRYFHPFQFAVEEFLGRLIHIVKSLSDPKKKERIKERFQHTLDGKSMDWFFNDQLGTKGGYFLCSTLHTTCQLFLYSKAILQNHPYFILKLNRNITNLAEGEDKKLLKSCINDVLKDEDLKKIFTYKKVKTGKLIKLMRIAISHKAGIPFSMHNSLGDFIDNDGKPLNYNDFCKQLTDENQRIKYLPVINFWSRLINEDGTIDKDRLAKLRKLIPILYIISGADLK